MDVLERLKSGASGLHHKQVICILHVRAHEASNGKPSLEMAVSQAQANSLMNDTIDHLPHIPGSGLALTAPVSGWPCRGGPVAKKVEVHKQVFPVSTQTAVYT